MTRLIHTAFALGLASALVGLPACDKGKKDDKDKQAAKGEDDKKADAPQPDEEAKPDGEAEADAPEAGKADTGDEGDKVAELDGDGRVDVTVDASGYHPAEIRAPAKSKVTLAFTRTAEEGCGQKLVVASMDLEKELPLNEAVEVEVEVPETGELGFACGMNMYKGKVVPKS